ncbi:hypothetical protein FRC91_17105 [Bradymonadales bacterium TMQ1]|uniref:4Fe-4S ferredoxin-type domain-containing protein n=1 Tax=Lujinxingia sediminis TaxID=2480984 RepID=A0ABY0CQS5_9DELT|nr:hypothetical protein EA187_13635 [Lujinxingia sediminis]TXC73167.1 hypothetical protein FRC91_17105 [Bradymonadales bacterium TMQ1]
MSREVSVMLGRLRRRWRVALLAGVVALATLSCARGSYNDLNPDPGENLAEQNAADRDREREMRRSLCPAGTTPCNGECVDLQSDAFHCGGCGEVCAPPGICDRGQCLAD